jgi:hypothetical protein
MHTSSASTPVPVSVAFDENLLGTLNGGDLTHAHLMAGITIDGRRRCGGWLLA